VAMVTGIDIDEAAKSACKAATPSQAQEQQKARFLWRALGLLAHLADWLPSRRPLQSCSLSWLLPTRSWLLSAQPSAG
jgi:hypothetical protein